MHSFEKSHPWINFDINLQEAPYTLWLLLGRAQSKVEHVINTPISPELSSELRIIHIAKGALATTAIEGNTLTEDQVKKRIKGNLKLPPSQEYLGQEIDNVLKAYGMVNESVLGNNQIDITPELLNHLNELVLANLTLDEDVVRGQLREHGVTVTGANYHGAPAEDLIFLINEFCERFNREFKGPNGYDIAFGILKAILAHVFFVWIHPYGDGNGRTARLLEFQILLSVGVPDTVAHLLTNFYYQTQSQYYRYLHKSSTEYQSGGLLSFVEYALQGLVDSLDEYLRRIVGHQLRVQWRDYVYDRFRKQDTQTAHRRRRLALDIADYYIQHERAAIPIEDIRGISTRIAEAYASKTTKTIQRDLNELEEMDLIIRNKKTFALNLEIMQGFKPRRRE